jgi:hypothetical protein
MTLLCTCLVYVFVEVLVYSFVLYVAVLSVSVQGEVEGEACCWQPASAVTRGFVKIRKWAENESRLMSSSCYLCVYPHY